MRRHVRFSNCSLPKRRSARSLSAHDTVAVETPARSAIGLYVGFHVLTTSKNILGSILSRNRALKNIVSAYSQNTAKSEKCQGD